MIRRIRELNESLPGMILIEFIYLIIGELIILLFIPWKLECGIGFMFGVFYACFCSIHMSLRIRKVVYGGGSTTKTLLIGYFIRLTVMFVIFAVLHFFHMGDLVAAIIGMFSMKVAAYLQPITDKFLPKS